jgi:hypothetical protein
MGDCRRGGVSEWEGEEERKDTEGEEDPCTLQIYMRRQHHETHQTLCGKGGRNTTG